MTQMDAELDDYLDNVLDEFDPKLPLKSSGQKAGLSAEAVEAKSHVELHEVTGLEDNEKLMAQLAAEMEKLLGPTPVSVSPAAEPPVNFQGKVEQTMEKLRSSSNQSSQLHDVEDDALKGMMGEIESLLQSGEFDDMFGGMMDKLMTKDILYEPLKELAAKYPPWIASHSGDFNPEEMEAYKNQHRVVAEIVAIFDKCGNVEPSGEDSKQMQSLGNPPDSLLKDIAPGMELDMPGMPSGAGEDCKQM